MYISRLSRRVAPSDFITPISCFFEADLAKALRYLHDRNIALQALLVATDKYLRFGMPEHELSQMRVLVNRLREPELAADDSKDIDSTLPI